MKSTVYDLGLAILAATLGLAGMIKLKSPMLLAVTMVRLGLIKSLQPKIAQLVGAIELTLCTALLALGRNSYTLLATTCLFSAFSLLLARALLQGKDAPCACFGRSQEPITLLTLIRTTGLLCLSATLLISGDLGPASPESRFLPIALVVSLASAATIVMHLYRDNPFRNMSLTGPPK